MAAPEPESRFTSSSTFAPLVIACSACCCWVDLSPSALEIVTGTPAASNAFFRKGRSTVSQRTDDFESGSRTAPLSAFPPLLLVLPLDLSLLSSPPHPAANSAIAPAMAKSASGPRRPLTPCMLLLLLRLVTSDRLVVGFSGWLGESGLRRARSP